jgi:Tol biopolymer transport system component
MRRWSAVLLVVGLLVVAAQPASPQYSGRNKVQYRTFKFEVLKTQHFDVYFYAEERAAVSEAARMAERWYARLSRVFTYELMGRQILVVYASHPHFEQTNIIEGEIGEGTGGVTEMQRRRIVVPLAESPAETDHVIGHELVHAFQYDICTLNANRVVAGDDSLNRLPLWFVEGMAEFLSIGSTDANTAMWMRDAASREKLPTIHQLSDPKYFPYRWGQAFWAYVVGRWGDAVVAALLRTASAASNAELALDIILNMSPANLSGEWHQALRSAARDVAGRARPPADYGRLVVGGANELANYDVSPSLSPDGRRLMFLSQRDILSLDLYLADAYTGRILRKIVDTALDPHFSSLQTVNSAGAWSADSRRFVFPVVRGGKPGLVIFDAAAGRTEREIMFQEIGEIFCPSWSPDGRNIAFSGLLGGSTDLFVYDLRTKTLRRLTEDAFADLQPAWSPDGTTLAFVTDRFSSQYSTLSYGNYRVGLLDVASGRIRPLEGADVGKNISPQWAGKSDVLFVSDRTGISNIYRTAVDGGLVRQLTDVATGVSGITATSPAISYASGAGHLAFSVYGGGRYSIYVAEDPRVLDGAPPSGVAGANPATLPPVDGRGKEIAGLLRNTEVGLLDAAVPQTVPYEAKLGLDLIGQPYAFTGIGSYGAFAGGGMAFYWSDMLADYRVGTTLQVSGSLNGGFDNFARSLGGQIGFENRKHRWNYGLTAGQVPYTSGSVSTGVTQRNGQTVGVQQTVIARQVERGAAGVASYPFNTAARFDVSAGVSNISFDQQMETTLFDPSTGNTISTERQVLPSPGALTLGQFSAALVNSTAIYGPTSPVAGQSYRLQVAPTVGTLHFTSVLADYRRYVMPVPFYTIAARITHFGRYGRDAEHRQLAPVYLGYPEFVRGYDINTFDTGDCTPSPTSTCPEFDRLVGSRVLFGGVELRFPLLRPLGVTQRMYGPVPLELGFYVDAGVAWNSGEKPTFLGGQREAVSSVGVAVRARLFGLLITEFDFSRPFQRTGHGLVFQFTISPGF